MTSLRLRAQDVRERDPLVPPRRRNFVGGGDFAEVGDEFLGHFRELGGLRPADRVLDIGCGIGRMARPLARFLDGGTYDGFDVNPEGIAWCERAYAEYPEFRFQVADLHNSRYRADAAQPAARYRFPYEDASFDFVLATSVFTHLLADDLEHYLAEAGRVLGCGGRLFGTFFLLDGDAPEPALDFRRAGEHMAVVDEAVPEEAVAFDAGWVRERLAAAGLGVVEARPGTWRGRDGLTYQDVVVAARA